MKYIWFVLLVEVMSVVDSHRPLTNGGSFEVSSFSTKPKTMAEVIYRMCFPKVPDYRGSFVVEIERVDQATGWDMMPITVDWFSYIGNGTVYQNLILWFPDAAGRRYINITTASKYCNGNGGQLVDIVDKAMYDVVYNYCRQTIVFGSHDRGYIWLGSSYNTTTDTVTQSNGKPGYYGDWRPGYPDRGSGVETNTGLFLRIQPPNTTDPYHGMLNNPRHWSYRYTIVFD
ncbi:uncharacterized protein LOC144749500 [Ciona intestinalis]